MKLLQLLPLLLLLSACKPDPANDCLHQFGKWEASEFRAFNGQPLQQRACEKCGMTQLRQIGIN